MTADESATWALVVGIDEYSGPGVPRLKGAGADAAAAVRWLLKIGVPAANILLNAAPSAENQAALAELQLPRGMHGASVDDIWGSIHELSQQTAGRRLMVFLSGHGLYEPELRRLFLAQDFGVRGDTKKNLSLDELQDYLRSLSFREQFMVMDGCQNYPYATSVRRSIQPGLPGVSDYTPSPNNGLIACYAAAMGDRAVEIDGRGAFMSCLLEALDPDLLGSDQLDERLAPAVEIDWTTGRRGVNVRTVVDDWVGYKVTDAAKKLSVQQYPQVIEFLAAGSHRQPLYYLPDAGVTTLLLDLRPPGAAPQVRTIVLNAVFPPARHVVPVPPATVVDTPVVKHVPKGVSCTARCTLVRDAVWITPAPYQEFTAELDKQQVTFDLQPLPAPVRGQPPATHHLLGVAIANPDGSQSFTTDSRYDEVARQLGLAAAPASYEEVDEGVILERRERGPAFVVSTERLVAGAERVLDWAAAFRVIMPPGTVVGTVLGAAAANLESVPNLRFSLPPTWARNLAGVLADVFLVAVEPLDAADRGNLWRDPDTGERDLLGAPGGRGDTSPRRLEAEPAMRVEPGPVRIRIDLPWGSWTQVAHAPVAGSVEVALPGSLGTPPLRLHLAEEATRVSTEGTPVILGVGAEPGPPVRGWARYGWSARRTGLPGSVSGLPGPVALIPQPPGSGAAWALGTPPRIGFLPDRAVLEGAPSVCFPLSDRNLAVDRSGGVIRVEPLTDRPIPEWDLLIATGRLDVLSPRDTWRLARAAGIDEILGLAAAYGLFATRSWGYLVEALGDVRSPQRRNALDSDLLFLTAAHHDDAAGRLSPGAVELLTAAARLNELPLLRWGVPMAISLLDRVGGAEDAAALRRWKRSLMAIERRLSPNSVWTAWSL